MAGASKAHVITTGNLSALIISHLRGTGCILYATAMKVRLASLNLFYCPDLAVTCDDHDRRSEEYALIHQTQILVKRFQRQSDTLWMPEIYRTRDTVEFASIGFACAIETLYETVAQLL